MEGIREKLIRKRGVWVVPLSKLDNLGRDMKKLKENVHTIQVGCQIYEGPHLDKECPLNEEVKQVYEVKYGEFGRPAPFKESNGAKKNQHEMEDWIKKLQENAEINTSNKNASLKNLETKIKQLTKELHSRTINEAPGSSTRQCKVVSADHETPNIPISSKERTIEVLQCQLPSKELNLGNFTLPCTIGNFNFYGMADLGAGVNVMPRNIFEYLRLANLRNTNMLVEMADMTKKAPLGKFHLRYGSCQLNDLIWGQSYTKWYRENSHNKPRIRDYTFREWMMIKVRHTNVNESVKKALLKSWVIDCFKEALDLDKDQMEISFDDYTWVFDLEIE
ncbi:mutator type transposase [Tanacetum coccineum]